MKPKKPKPDYSSVVTIYKKPSLLQKSLERKLLQENEDEPNDEIEKEDEGDEGINEQT